ncbi:hypothetical protein HHK36_017051 [Tetracentron sinense]|uniref:3'-5' exonuclease domain-containing protein n=1 Tax=Tetracentron sinense TaxID=13715 RepID=A0A834Z3V9_TETSI|nr:hypothetical protein HHK36_017051 [Tetracentron sinense]
MATSSSTATASPGISIVQLQCPSGSNLIYDVRITSKLSSPKPHILWIPGSPISKEFTAVETRTDFTGRKIQYPAATIQICVGRNCLIFQSFLARSVPSSLFQFLGNPNYTFTGVAIADDAKKLLKDYGLVVLKTLDLRDLAVRVFGKTKYKKMGLKVLTRVVLEREIPKRKKDTLSNWNNFDLTYNQIKYACIDTYVSFEIARKLISIERSGNRADRDVLSLPFE